MAPRSSLHRLRWALSLAALLFPLDSFAQPTAASPGEPAQHRKWDFGGSFGFWIPGTLAADPHWVWLGQEGFPVAGSYKLSSDPSNSTRWTVDVGRYFTDHLKAEVGLVVVTANEIVSSAYEPLPRGSAITNKTASPASVSFAGAYQFRENAFVHPYVSAGMRLTSLTESRETWSSSPSYSRLAIESQRSLLPLPFVAGGIKAYFNEPTFVRSEVLMTFGAYGFTHATVRIGAGVDF